jgi:hypothetical protein
MKTYKVSGRKAPRILNYSTRWKNCQFTFQSLYTRGQNPRYHWRGGWVHPLDRRLGRPQCGRDDVNKNSCLCRGSNKIGQHADKTEYSITKQQELATNKQTRSVIFCIGQPNKTLTKPAPSQCKLTTYIHINNFSQHWIC